jgi:hypothetical protein
MNQKVRDVPPRIVKLSEGNPRVQKTLRTLLTTLNASLYCITAKDFGLHTYLNVLPGAWQLLTLGRIDSFIYLVVLQCARSL